MKLNLRIFVTLTLTIGVILYYYYDFVRDDIGRKYKEAMEESLNDTANLLASFIEADTTGDIPGYDRLVSVFENAKMRRFDAAVYELVKNRMDIDIYITDRNGIIVYDSNDGVLAGEDYSLWNDVYLTLKGQYGARSTRDVTDDPLTDALYVAAPIMHQGELLGVVSVKKPKQNITRFAEIAKKKFFMASTLSFAGIFLLVIIISFWTTRPVSKLIRYVRSLKTHKRLRFPRLGNTEIRELGLAFEEIREELEGKKYIEKYVQTLTHEIKSPLSSIRGAAELLEEDMPAEQKLRFYRNIRTESLRIEKLISRMLELSSLENQKQLRDISQILITRLCNEIMESRAPAVNAKQIEIDITGDNDLTVMGEEFLIRHSVANLVDNAIRFCPVDGKIGLNVDVETDRVIVTVSDTGPGIPDFAVDRIFERFYSLPPEKHGKKSTGLGLAFVKEAVELHGGSIEILNNEAGKGVSARLILPKC